MPFGTTDPLFHRDASFFVFRLPFLSFLVDWLLVALLVAFIVSAIGHFLNGAIRFQGSPQIEPRALAHLSLLLGLMALVRAWAYFFVDRFTLDLSSNGFVSGAGYTDVHVRLPAMSCSPSSRSPRSPCSSSTSTSAPSCSRRSRSGCGRSSRSSSA